jgi:hypothetical protein
MYFACIELRTKLPRRPQCLHLTRQKELYLVPRIKQRLDSEPVTCRKKLPACLVPKRYRELTTKVMQALRTEVLIQVQRNLAALIGFSILLLDHARMALPKY